MAQASTIAMALASPTPSVDIPKFYDAGNAKADFSDLEKLAHALLTPPNSISPDLPAHVARAGAHSPPPMNIECSLSVQDGGDGHADDVEIEPQDTAGTPLSKGALSGLDASAAITPGMLAKHHLPGIMLGNGPRPIRYVMGELTQSVPGFSRIPPAKARRLVVAALENRGGGGLDGSVAFCKTGWGRWDAHVKGSSRDSGIGSYQDGRLSPPRSERSSYAVSHSDSAIHMAGPRMPSRYREQHSGGSWTASSIREQDEFDMDVDMDMDVPENEADKMSLDGVSSEDDLSDIVNEETDDDDDWAAVAPDTLRKASLPTPGAPKKNYNAISASYSSRWPSKSWSRRPSAISDRSFHSKSMPNKGSLGVVIPVMPTPEEQAAAAALLQMGSM